MMSKGEKTPHVVIAAAKDDGQFKAVEVRKQETALEVLWTKSLPAGDQTWTAFAAACGLAAGSDGHDKALRRHASSVVGLDSTGVAFYRVTAPAVESQEMASIVRMQAESLLPLPPDQIEVAWRTTPSDERQRRYHHRRRPAGVSAQVRGQRARLPAGPHPVVLRGDRQGVAEPVRRWPAAGDGQRDRPRGRDPDPAGEHRTGEHPDVPGPERRGDAGGRAGHRDRRSRLLRGSRGVRPVGRDGRAVRSRCQNGSGILRLGRILELAYSRSLRWQRGHEPHRGSR